ncbi:NTP transferase domain-containing protein [Mangrovicella endophytica]|uniref:NTP transferase domain-containing protein n=1 Tax=Mangrovicella endophytica TaxID=2066697 RepID=UPI000C9DC0C2|nr:molybdopterin-binding/glycosyltransferase family 2 protein [Mangrovicella endophytica]
MRFGAVPLAEAEGAILAHAIVLEGRRLRKGTLLRSDDLAALRSAGVETVIAAQLDPGDFGEDEAAHRLGAALEGDHVVVGPASTGRVNLFAAAAGLLVPDRAVVDALNEIDPGITLATLAEWAPVEAGRMVATVKIIPLAVPGTAVERAVQLLATQPAFHVAPFRPRRVRLIQTELPGVKESVLDKTRRVLAQRLAASHSAITTEMRVPHDTAALADVLSEPTDAELSVVFGASAVIDRGDVIPAAIVAAGGTVDQLGMPVDPGNLLCLGRLGGLPVLGAPGCARSPKENGFDWVLNRLLADLPISGEAIRRMGVGGLLMEIASRPQPREAESAEMRPRVDVVVLAAGRSSRMRGPNKLLARFDGVPLVRRSVLAALESSAGRVHVVVGHQKDEIVAALGGLDVELIDNQSFADGLSTSLIAGFRAAADDADGVLVMLADQPLITADDLDRLIDLFEPSGEGSIVLAADGGKRANPVILSASFLGEIAGLSGDVGARGIVAANPDAVRVVELGRAASLDVDTPELLAEAGGVIWG